jgi:hypothetical protein
LELQIPGVEGVKHRDSSPQESQNDEMRNSEMSLIRLHFRVSDTGTWSCQELSHQECLNRDMRNQEEIWTVESSRVWTIDPNPFRRFGYRELEESRVETLHQRSLEILKCEMPKCEM